jgi:tripartite-type tricarboxylate transporter receptor subunit TctC
MRKLTSLFAFAFVAASAMWSTSIWAGDYPERPIGVTVTYGAGGATDFQARIVTMVAGNKDLLGQPIFIINKPGAGGRVGWNWFATEADKDGYTLASYNVPHFIAQSIKGGVKYSVDSFEPIANWGSDPAVVVVKKDSDFKTLKDMVEFAKKNPGKLTVSGGGLYIGHHIAFLQLEKASGTKMAYIPTKGGGAQAMKDVIAGNVLAGINNLSDAFRAREAGNVRILAIADLERNKEFLPDVPTMKEAGYDVDDSSVNFRGLMVPKGTPQNIIDLLVAKVPEMFKNARVAKRMKAGGSPMKIMTRDEVLKMWQERQKYLTELLKDL